MEKLKKISTVADVILRILQWCIVVGFVLITILMIVAITFGSKIYPVLNTSLSINVGFVTFTPDVQTVVQVLKSPAFKIAVFLFVLAIDILFAIYWYGIGVFHKILVPMKAGRPFEEGVSKLFKRLAWVVLIGGCFNEILLLIAEAVAKEGVSIYAPDRLALIQDFNVNLNLNFLLIALLIFLLSLIFRYGEELQRESDETL